MNQNYSLGKHIRAIPYKCCKLSCAIIRVICYDYKSIKNYPFLQKQFHMVQNITQKPQPNVFTQTVSK